MNLNQRLPLSTFLSSMAGVFETDDIRRSITSLIESSATCFFSPMRNELDMEKEVCAWVSQKGSVFSIKVERVDQADYQPWGLKPTMTVIMNMRNRKVIELKRISQEWNSVNEKHAVHQYMLKKLVIPVEIEEKLAENFGNQAWVFDSVFNKALTKAEISCLHRRQDDEVYLNRGEIVSALTKVTFEKYQNTNVVTLQFDRPYWALGQQIPITRFVCPMVGDEIV